MQLLFTRQEMVLLATLLEQCERRLRGPAGGSDQAEADRRRRHAHVEALLEGIGGAQPEFDADQLDDLSDALRDCKEQATEELSATTNEQSKIALQQRLKTLQHLVDKVTEACAMA